MEQREKLGWGGSWETCTNHMVTSLWRTAWLQTRMCTHQGVWQFEAKVNTGQLLKVPLSF